MLPTLSTERLTLVPLSDEHLPFEMVINADPQVQRYIMGRPATRDEIVASHARCLAMAARQPPRGVWVGSLRDTDTPVGLWALIPAEGDGAEREAELGYRLLPAYWHKGLASDGGLAVLEYAFASQKLRRMTALSMRMHTATRKTLERLGFVYVEDVPTETPQEHPEYEELDALYELPAERWAASKAEA
ncbi:hypothetical protein NLG97_g1725 [Lecanicillium saksenae]|uniref:Uncharacterized protein n=1 Tax=Lecanicillium saksenae TaxID=468837 RepID=A0ACC1R2Y4_9HYPO|nr:hypothetical protein NLG97_g1725 [Lecanicillium saksenae]